MKMVYNRDIVIYYTVIEILVQLCFLVFTFAHALRYGRAKADLQRGLALQQTSTL